MKIYFSLLIVYLCFSNLYAQFSNKNIIANSIDGVTSVISADVDSDGDMDVISASMLDNSIAWYENVNGLGEFGSMQIISNNSDGAYSVFASDIDGDNDIDIMTASFYENHISWYENIDGAGNFSSEIIISTNINGAISVFATDLDSDGDIDIISASHNNDKISWFENIDGQGNFGKEQILSTNAVGAVSVFISDGDGDMDIISASRNDNKICWYINMDGNGNFSSEKIITTDLLNVSSIYIDDMDLDGDNDVIATSWSENKVVWYNNTSGHGSFSTEQVISTNVIGASSIFSVDLNGDNGKDILTASFLGDEIMWFENRNTLSNNDNYLYEISLFPNPTNGNLNIHSKNMITQIEIYSITGQLVRNFSNQNKIDISNLNDGIYMLRIRDIEGFVSTKKVIKI